MQIPMLGTAEKTSTSRFQIALADETDKNLHPMDYPRTDRFFDTITDRNQFVTLFETSIRQAGGRLVKNPLTHPLFVSFDIFDKYGVKTYSITVYH